MSLIVDDNIATNTGRHIGLPGGADRRVLVLSTSLLTDRMIAGTLFLDKCREGAEVRVWAKSAKGAGERLWRDDDAGIEPYPEVRQFRIFPYTYLRRLNEFAWDWRFRTFTRRSIDQHLRRGRQPLSVRAMRWPARCISAVRGEQVFETFLHRRLLDADRGPEAASRLNSWTPELVVATDPFWYFDCGVAAAARKAGSRCLALITSFDNLSTKNRMPFRYDGFLLWSEQMRKELHELYPYSRELPCYVIGAPQFDILRQEKNFESREDFCQRIGFDPAKPLILHALGSPNLFREEHTVRYLARQVASGALGDVQLLVRPHPLFDDNALSAELAPFGDRVKVLATATLGGTVNDRAQGSSQLRFWVNSFRHADVVVNLSSTCTVDAAILDRPVVNMNYDPDPSKAREQLVKEINHQWIHFKPIAESGGVWLVNNDEELIDAIKGYLRQPALHREKRRWIAEHVAGFTDGRSGERMAEAVLDFLRRKAGDNVIANRS